MVRLLLADKYAGPHEKLGKNILDSALALGYPRTEVWPFERWPTEDGGVQVEFRLTYQGPLPAADGSGGRTRKDVKHQIRCALHEQLKELWRTHPFISAYFTRGKYKEIQYTKTIPYSPIIETQLPDGSVTYDSGPAEMRATMFTSIMRQRLIDELSARYARCGYSFLPLIGGAFGAGTETVCALDVLFLRRDMPGGIIVKGKGGGDIDNRLKVLFDALRMPETCDEIPKNSKYVPSDAHPFFCLLETDALITEVKVTTDRLLTPLASDEHINDVHLIIHVKTMAVGATFADIGAPIPPHTTEMP